MVTMLRSTSSRWEERKAQFVAYLDLKGVQDTNEKHKALVCFGGPDVRKIAKNIVGDGALEDPYQVAMQALDDFYSPRMSLHYERFKFRQLTFNPKEKVDQFVLRLKSQAEVCSFDNQLNNMIMDQIVFATQTDKLRAKYLERDTTLDEMLQIGRTYETVNKQVQEFGFKSADGAEINALQKTGNKFKGNLSCSRCMGNHLSPDSECPARSSRCNRCTKLGHFARCCRGIKKTFQQSKPFTNNKRIQKPIDRRNHGNLGDQKPKFVREVDDVTKNLEIRELSI
ncbi:uncharacterized protein LOC129728698 [Wyeomyia smithii]|uniref:uncharacterized protein LOC129728698 n=1 Tax=Wyeomyia smithii TaxID=174621 RepID=UPI002467E0BF|nr:uncharacterized protein LOC129728698 [Wyeomyia smithii]